MNTEDDGPAMGGPARVVVVGATGARKSVRRELPALFAEPAHAHLRIVRLRRPRDAEAWLAGRVPD